MAGYLVIGCVAVMVVPGTTMEFVLVTTVVVPVITDWLGEDTGVTLSRI